MSFLKRLALIRQINNGQDAEHIGSHPEGITFIEESHGRSCVISEPTLVKALLEHPDAHAYNPFEGFLADVEPNSINHLLHFLTQSPEFLEGNKQRLRMKETKRILKNFETACRQAKPEDLQDAIKKACTEADEITASLLSKAALSSHLNQALKRCQRNVETQPFSPESIATKAGIFTATTRLKSLQELNQSIRNQWGDSQAESTEDEQYLLELLRIMGSHPIYAAITGSLNALKKLNSNKRDKHSQKIF